VAEKQYFTSFVLALDSGDRLLYV